MIEDSLENVANMFVKSAPDAVEDFAIDGREEEDFSSSDSQEQDIDFSSSDSSQEQDIDVVDENDFESSEVNEEEPENAVDDFANDIDGMKTEEREEDFSSSDSQDIDVVDENDFESSEVNDDVVDENDFESSNEEELENSSPEKNVESVFRFNLESTMEWKVGDRIFPFETTSCKERSEIDFDNLISGTATRDGLWTSEGNFVSADASKRCPLDGRCEGMLLFMKSNLYENKPTNSKHKQKAIWGVTMRRCRIAAADCV